MQPPSSETVPLPDSSFFNTIRGGLDEDDIRLLLGKSKKRSASEAENVPKFCDDRSRYEAAAPAEPPLIPRCAFVLPLVIYFVILLILAAAGILWTGGIIVSDYEKLATMDETIRQQCGNTTCLYYQSNWTNCADFCVAGGSTISESTFRVAWKSEEDRCKEKKETAECIRAEDLKNPAKYPWSDWSPCLIINSTRQKVRRKKLPMDSSKFVNLQTSANLLIEMVRC